MGPAAFAEGEVRHAVSQFRLVGEVRQQIEVADRRPLVEQLELASGVGVEVERLLVKPRPARALPVDVGLHVVVEPAADQYRTAGAGVGLGPGFVLHEPLDQPQVGVDRVVDRHHAHVFRAVGRVQEAGPASLDPVRVGRGHVPAGLLPGHERRRGDIERETAVGVQRQAADGLGPERGAVVDAGRAGLHVHAGERGHRAGHGQTLVGPHTGVGRFVQRDRRAQLHQLPVGRPGGRLGQVADARVRQRRVQRGDAQKVAAVRPHIQRVDRQHVRAVTQQAGERVQVEAEALQHQLVGAAAGGHAVGVQVRGRVQFGHAGAVQVSHEAVVALHRQLQAQHLRCVGHAELDPLVHRRQTREHRKADDRAEVVFAARRVLVTDRRGQRVGEASVRGGVKPRPGPVQARIAERQGVGRQRVAAHQVRSRPAVTHVADLLGVVRSVVAERRHRVAVRVGQGQVFAAGAQAEVRVQVALRVHRVQTRSKDHQVVTGIQHRALTEAPLRRVAGVVGQVVVRQVHRGVAGVVQLDPVGVVPEAVGQRAAVAGHELGDERIRGEESTGFERFEALRRHKTSGKEDERKPKPGGGPPAAAPAPRRPPPPGAAKDSRRITPAGGRGHTKF